jgi:hypothetical protein
MPNGCVAYDGYGEFMFSNLLWSIPIAKIAYTAVLGCLILFFAREIYTIWADDQLYVGRFEYFSEGKAEAESSKNFPSGVLAQHHLLRSALLDETHRRQRQAAAETEQKAEIYKNLLPTIADVTQWKSALADVELKIQSFDIGKLLSQLRTWVSPPAEITGYVEKSGGTVRASVSWPPVIIAGNGEDKSVQFETGPLAGDNSAALAIAASIAWLQAAKLDSNFRKIRRETFVAWVLVWSDYRAIRDRIASGQAWGDEDKKRWKQARTLVDKLIDQAPTYPEIWRLRAELIDATPPGEQKSPEEVARAKEDLRKYAEAIGKASVAAISASAPATNVESIAPPDDTLIRPGRLVWGRTAAHTGADFAVTSGIVVVDAAGRKSVVLPGYAVPPSGDGPIEFRLSPAGPVVARASRSDIIASKDGDTAGGDIALAQLDPKAQYTNTAIIGSTTIAIANVADPPPVGAELTLLSSKGIKTSRLAEIAGDFIRTEGRVTSPGDGGAPVLNADKQLVAMAHSGNEKASEFLRLKNIFDSRGLRLAP